MINAMNILKYCLSALAICSSMVAAAQGGVTEREAWFDFNFAARQAISASPASLDISSLPAGLHWFTMRVKDDLGLWSSQKTNYFIIPHEEVEEDVELVSSRTGLTTTWPIWRSAPFPSAARPWPV